MRKENQMLIKIFLALVFVVCGVLAIAALNAGYKTFGGFSLIAAGFALLILAALSVTISLIAIVAAGFLCTYTHTHIKA